MAPGASVVSDRGSMAQGWRASEADCQGLCVLGSGRRQNERCHHSTRWAGLQAPQRFLTVHREGLSHVTQPASGPHAPSCSSEACWVATGVQCVNSLQTTW